MDIKVYGKEGCGYCSMARSWLNDNNLSYEYISLDDNVERQSFYKEHEILRQSVPQIFIDNKRIGGYDQLMENSYTILDAAGMIFDKNF